MRPQQSRGWRDRRGSPRSCCRWSCGRADRWHRRFEMVGLARFELACVGRSGTMNKLEVAVGLEPTKIGFADRRLDRFGIATLYPKSVPKAVRKPPAYRLFTPYNLFASR